MLLTAQGFVKALEGNEAMKDVENDELMGKLWSIILLNLSNGVLIEVARRKMLQYCEQNFIPSM